MKLSICTRKMHCGIVIKAENRTHFSLSFSILFLIIRKLRENSRLRITKYRIINNLSFLNAGIACVSKPQLLFVVLEHNHVLLSDNTNKEKIY